ncbi:thiamine-phosphate kinase, partial [Vibrio parahaemolyticus]|nr:thiamine-phosphate kinase [Vibrio parahaemolyticus]
AKAGLDVILDDSLRSRAGAEALERAHYLSSPRVLAGQALVGLASSAIDISDCLISDIKHILQRSQVGVSIDVSQLPISSELVQFLDDKISAQQYALASGEEYELCFTVPEQNRGSLQSALSH